MAKKFYQRKLIWILLILAIPISIYAYFLIRSPIPTFRNSIARILRLWNIEKKVLIVNHRPVQIYEGGKNHPETVILLHGFGGNALLTWMRIMPALTKKYHVIAPDLLASNFLTLNPYRYSIQSEADLVLAIMNQLKIEQASFVGLSVGGWTSLLITLSHPNMVNKLILIESAGTKTEVPEIASLILTDREAAKKFLHLLFYNPPPLPGFVLDQMVLSSTRVRPIYLRILKYFLKNSEPYLVDQRLQSIQKPTLIIHGREDQVVPLAAAEKMHQEIPHSRLFILEKSGHAPVWDQPKKLKKAILDFLEDASPD